MLVTIQIVNYNSRDNLRACLEAIRENLPQKCGLEAILINNESQELKINSWQNDFPFELRVLEAGENLGFGRAHNLGAAEAKGELIFFLNPDTRVRPGAIDELVSVFENREVGIAGPQLLGESGQVENEHYGKAKTPFFLVQAKFRSPSYSREDKVRAVDWVSGGALMIRRDLFCELGKFDENYFMYFEDVDLCLRAKRRGVKIMMNPLAEIVHQGGRSYTSQKTKKKHYYSSQNYYLRKNFGIFAALAFKILRWPLYLKNVYFNRS